MYLKNIEYTHIWQFKLRFASKQTYSAKKRMSYLHYKLWHKEHGAEFCLSIVRINFFSKYYPFEVSTFSFVIFWVSLKCSTCAVQNAAGGSLNGHWRFQVSDPSDHLSYNTPDMVAWSWTRNVCDLRQQEKPLKRRPVTMTSSVYLTATVSSQIWLARRK